MMLSREPSALQASRSRRNRQVCLGQTVSDSHPVARLPISSSPLRWRTWGLSMLQHWISSAIWAKKSATFPATTEAQFLFQRICDDPTFQLSAFAQLILNRYRTNSHSNYVFNFCFQPLGTFTTGDINNNNNNNNNVDSLK